ncbi:MAG TPA: hypothetical protein VFB81_19795, partial [Myxococcales bacterium]|nr:hypothetical protein [Myxococcales bacterium]
MASVLAVFWTWKVALGVLSAAAVVWFLLAAFVASRWPAVHPWLGRLRPTRVRAVLVTVLVALAVGGLFVSRSAEARSRAYPDEFGRRRPERRLVLLGDRLERRVMIRDAWGQERLTMVHVGSPCQRRSANVEVDVDARVDLADVDLDEEQREAIAEAREAAEEAREAQEEAQARAEEARERARERVEEARERARERAERARERAQEIAERQMERAQAVLERMGDEMDHTRDAVEEDFEDGDEHHGRSRMEEFLERQAQKVEQLGRSVAEQLRGLASRLDGD